MPRKRKEHEEVERLYSEFQQLVLERYEWDASARDVSDYLLPGRGIFSTHTKPKKKRLTSQRVINPMAREALEVLTSGFQGGLTSPSRPWFKLQFVDPELRKHPILGPWLLDSAKRLYAALASTNFYLVMCSFYTEYIGYGTASMFVGEGTSQEDPFHFETLTFGEYVIEVNNQGLVDTLFRVVFLTTKVLIEEYGEDVPKEILQEHESSPNANIHHTVIEATKPEQYLDMPFKRVTFLLASRGRSARLASGSPLRVEGFNEFPYPTGRADLIGSDVYGLGLGEKAVQDIKRLQQLEKAFLMASHKQVNPPLNAPAKMRGRTNSLPGGVNYYSNPAETVNALYGVQFDYRGVLEGVNMIEDRIRRVFFNDIFLTASRDPNASPLKATEVNVKEQEKLLRLGPMIGRLQYEVHQKVIGRCLNILMRKGMLRPLPPEMQEEVADYEVVMTSVLAQAQKAIAAQPIQNFLTFVSGVASLDHTALDKISTDEAIDEYADVTGVPENILRPQEAVEQKRAERQQRMAAEQKKKNQMEQLQVQGAIDQHQADVSKTYSEAGLNTSNIMGGVGGA